MTAAATDEAMTRSEAIEVIQSFYGGQAVEISISLHNDEGDFFWTGVLHDADGSRVGFTMPDHCPSAFSFDY